MDGNTVFLTRGTEAITLATTLDNNNQHEEALEQYKLGIDLLSKAAKYAKNPAEQQMIKERLLGYMSRAEKIKAGLHGDGGDSPKGSGGGSGVAHRKDGGDGGGGGKKADDDRTRLENQMAGAIVTELPNVKWTDVAGLEIAKASLQEAVILPAKFPQLFTGKRKPWKGILLYGPPGTGKSFLAKAVATEASGSTFFSVSASDLMSKWIGEGEKLVKVLFAMAHEKKPSVIFVDEIDSVATARSEGENEASRRIKTEFMANMDGVGKSMDGVLVLAATNVPWEIDSAIRRRFTKRVYIALPEADARAHMFQLNLGETPHSVTADQFLSLGELTPMYSGSDIYACTQEALMEPVRKCQHARQFILDSEGFFSPCGDYPNCPDCPMDLSPDGARALGYTNTIAAGKLQCTVCKALRMTFDQIPDPSKLRAPEITYGDFRKALKRSKPNIGAQDLERFETWTHEFGSEGN